MKVFCPLYIPLSTLDDRRIDLFKTYLAGAAHLATILPEHTLVVHFYNNQPQNFIQFTLMRINGWLQASEQFPDNWWWSTDADIIPTEGFPLLLDYLTCYPLVTVGYEVIEIDREYWFIKEVFPDRHPYEFHVLAGAWGGQLSIFRQVATTTLNLYLQWLSGLEWEQLRWMVAFRWFHEQVLWEEHALSIAVAEAPTEPLRLTIFDEGIGATSRKYHAEVVIEGVPHTLAWFYPCRSHFTVLWEALASYLEQPWDTLWRLIQQRQIVLPAQPPDVWQLVADKLPLS